jgi:hypothetical protein
MKQYILTAADKPTMFAGLLAAGLATETEGEITPTSASQTPRFDLFWPHTILIEQAVLAEDGTVVEPAVIEAGYHVRLLDQGLSILAVSATLAANDVTLTESDGSAVVAGAEPTLAELQAAKLRQLSDIFRAKRDAGMTIGGVAYATTPAAVQELSELVKLLDRNGGTMKFRTRSGAIVKGVTLSAATAIYEAVTDRQAVLQAAEVDHAEAIMAATAVELEDMDLTTGWSA